MKGLRELAVDASIPRGASFADAARVLARTGAAAVAVLEGDKVVGLLSADDVLRGIFPGYLADLEHTAFIGEDALAAQLERAEAVDRHMSRPVTVRTDAGSAHVAEIFLHCPYGAVALVDENRYIGMVDEAAFVAAVVEAAERD